jgi:hypothetical protein
VVRFPGTSLQAERDWNMGYKIFNICAEREALELTCDSHSHGYDAPRAWFDCGSGNTSLAMAPGWRECRRNGTRAWLCPQCAKPKYRAQLPQPGHERIAPELQPPGNAGGDIRRTEPFAVGALKGAASAVKRERQSTPVTGPQKSPSTAQALAPRLAGGKAEFPHDCHCICQN